MAPVEYIIPLLPLDRLVLDSVEGVLTRLNASNPLPILADPPEVFQLWTWTIRITKHLREDLDQETVDRDHDSDLETAYADVLNWLRHSSRSLAQATFRIDALEDANPSFLVDLGENTVQDVKCVPSPHDAYYWNLLQRIHSQGNLKLRKDSLFQPTGSFDVWEAMHTLLIQSTRIQEALDLYQTLFNHETFTSLYEFRLTAGSQDEDHQTRGFDVPEADIEHSYKKMRIEAWSEHQALELFHRSNQEQMERRPKYRPKDNVEENITRDDLEYLLKDMARNAVLEDSRNYLHVVPWSDLKSISWQSVESSTEIDDPFDDIRPNNRISGYMLWELPDEASKWLSHLRTEEEVLQYCMAKDWPLPGHLYIDKAASALFALKPIEDTLLLQQLDQFWDLWNDCAITIRPDDKHIFALETIPGMQFRSRITHQDTEAAIKYFRNVVEAHHAGSLHLHIIADLLGSGNTRPYFDKSLQIIPENQISEISPNPIGRGANGAVYAAMWQRPPGILATTTHKAALISVVLKEIFPVNREPDTLGRLLRELNLTYLALAGNNVGCVDFLGVTTLSKPEHNTDTAEFDNSVNRKLLLVFERATEGSIFDYLDRILPGLSFMESWTRVNDIISSIANGLNSLHKHSIVHRDLHPNNVLVVRRYYVGDSEDSAIVTDIGEGKILDTRDVDVAAGASYGCSEFRAPEVRGVQGWSSAADVFSFGVLCCKVLELRINVCNATLPGKLQQLAQNSDVEDLMPKEIATILQSCLSRTPSDRPGIRSVIKGLNRLSQDFWYEEKGYTAHAALRDEPEELLNQIQWCLFNWEEALAIAQGDIADPRVSKYYATRDSILDEN